MLISDSDLRSFIRESLLKKMLQEKLGASKSGGGPRTSRSSIAGRGSSSPKEKEDVINIEKMSTSQKQLYDDLFSALKNQNLSIAMVANAQGESAMNYSIAGDCGDYGEKNSKRAINTADKGYCCSFGLWQFNICKGLGVSLLKAYGVNVDNSTPEEKLAVLSSYDKQVEFMIKEVKKMLGSKISDEKSVSYWVEWFVVNVERPKNPAHAIATRTEIARNIAIA